MSKSRRDRRRSQLRWARHGRTTESVVPVDIDADAFEWEDSEAAIFGAWSWYSSWVGGPLPVEGIFGPNWRQDETVLASLEHDPVMLDAVRDGDPVRGVMLVDGDGDDFFLVFTLTDDEDEARRVFERETAAFVAERVGRRGMLDLALAWAKDGPFATMDRDWRRRGPNAIRSVAEAFNKWRASYFHDGWSVRQPSASHPTITLMAVGNERAQRLAAESEARAGDRVLAGGKVHCVERPSFMLAGWVRTYCGETVRYELAGDEPLPACRRCAKASQRPSER